MLIHIVEPGDTVFNIAQRYKISPSRLIIENGITDPNHLVVNDALIILEAEQLYIVREGDTIDRIASLYNIDVMQLLRNNPNVSQRGYLVIGEEIVISYVEEDEKPLLSINGYVFPFIDRTVLKTTLPYLTYINIMYYRLLSDGTIIGLDDEDDEIIQLSESYGVAPIMYISLLDSNNQFDPDTTHEILNNEEIKLTLIEDLLRLTKVKGYKGVNFYIPYISLADRELFLEFGRRVLSVFNSENLLVFITITPSSFEVSTGIEYEGIGYEALNQVANSVVFLLTYDWYNPLELPKSALPFDTVIQSILKNMSTISPDHFNLGYASVGFIWTLPFIEYEDTRFITVLNAIELAYEVGTSISFNENTRSVYYIYIANNHENLVWYNDVRFIDELIEVIKEYGIQAVSFWNVVGFLPRQLLMYNVNFEIVKII